MSMVKCGECKAEISSGAKKCPQCGKQRTSGCLKVFAIFLAITFACGILITCVSNSGKEKAAFEDRKLQVIQEEANKKRLAEMTPEQRIDEDKKIAAQQALAEKAKLREAGFKWNYKNIPDEMGSGSTKTAVLKSLNTLNLDFPYQGEQRATLIIRKHPNKGADVMVQVERGQLHCAYQNCFVNLRFDEGKQKRVGANEPSDRSSETYFLDNAPGLIGQIKKAKKVRVELEMFQQGSHVMEFDVSDLDW